MNFRLPKKRLPKKIIFICIILISIILFIKYDQNGLKEREIINKGKYMSESLVADKEYDEAKKWLRLLSNLFQKKNTIKYIMKFGIC
ncbi:hypothetical protein [Clostridioides difficile]|uniref:hypothetical protein n=1 Tax=Clostridioides difficile TaxID=1496 RepID=UPI0030CCD11A